MSEFEKKVLEFLETINKKLDILIGGEIKLTPEQKDSPSEGYVKPSAVVERQDEEERQQDKPSVDGRRVCPDCNGTDFRTEEDREKVVFQQGGMKMYAKKYICKKCGKTTY